MKDTYTQALLALLSETDDISVVLEGFAKTLTERGHQQLHAPVLQAVLRVLSAQRPSTSAVAGSVTEAATLAAAIKTELEKLGAVDDVAVAIDETLIGGYIVEHNHQRVDQSYKAKLVALYRSLTT